MLRRDSIGAGAVGLEGISDEPLAEENAKVAPSNWYTSSVEKQATFREATSPPLVSRKMSGTAKKNEEKDFHERHSVAVRFRRRKTMSRKELSKIVSSADATEQPDECPLSPTMGAKIGGYNVVRSMGQGGEGSIYLVSKPEDPAKEFILKRRFFETIEEGNIGMREVLAMARVSFSPYCVSLVDVFQVGQKHGLACCLVMEHCKNGDLLERLVDIMDGKEPPLQVPDVKRMVRDIAYGLNAIHSSGFSHRDLKLENIVLDANGQCKICDFGVAAPSTEKLHGFVGSFFYAAPEMESDRNGTFSSKVDIWALGIVLFELASNCVWKAKYGMESLAMKAVANADYDPASIAEDLPADVRAEYAPVLSCLLRKEAHKRLTAASLLDNPFLCQLVNL